MEPYNIGNKIQLKHTIKPTKKGSLKTKQCFFENGVKMSRRED